MTHYLVAVKADGTTDAAAVMKVMKETPINDMFANYFRQAGFDVLGMEGITVPFEDVGQLSPYEVYAHVKRAYLAQPKAEAIYLLGSGWRVMEVIDMLEQDLGVPVIHPIVTRSWEIQLRLSVRQPVKGYGRLLAEMPRD